jgi:hypothetical protein
MMLILENLIEFDFLDKFIWLSKSSLFQNFFKGNILNRINRIREGNEFVSLLLISNSKKVLENKMREVSHFYFQISKFKSYIKTKSYNLKSNS